jgi:predicted alpha/beta superfamily hydrolase
MRLLYGYATGLVLCSSSVLAQTNPGGASPATPLTLGETFTIQSRILGEVRRINVYAPPAYTESRDVRLPVLYMPDGGMAEDFLHVAGMVQVSVGNGTMRPFLLVGIENTQRRRDLTGPTQNPEDRKIAPVVGGSAAFRRFIRSELMPTIKARYRTAPETGIMGESLAGLFVVETFFLEPDLFDTFIAFDPSLWWNSNELVQSAASRLRTLANRRSTLYLASSSEPELATLTRQLADRLTQNAPATLTWHYEPMPAETHATIYHPAALRAIRRLFKPAPANR